MTFCVPGCHTSGVLTEGRYRGGSVPFDMSEENKRKHLDFIQLVIARMGVNSFLLKGWSVTLVAAVFALADRAADSRYLLAAYLPNVIFWGLDGYYLYTEKLYRKLYEDVADDKPGIKPFHLDVPQYREGFRGWVKVLFSRTVIWFYAPLAVLIGILKMVAR